MSGSKVNTYGIGDANIQALMLSTDKLFKGFHKVSLTNYDSTSESQIAAGSVIECAGALYKFDSNESMTGSPSDGTVYIRIVPGTTTCTAEYTNTAPTWSDAYQGWYGTGGAVTYRYLEFRLAKDSSTWINKTHLILESILYFRDNGTNNFNFMKKIIDIGSWNMDSTANIHIAHGLTLSKIMSVKISIYNDDLTILYPDITQTYNGSASASGGFYIIDSTVISITRYASAFFDSSSFDSTLINRGFIIIDYVY